MQIETVDSWRELDEAIAEAGARSAGQHMHPTLVFRGLARADRANVSRLSRLGEQHADVERHLIRNFRKYAHRETPGPTLWDWLALGQHHHGLPTRLLDWTYSPQVALHFATSAWAERDGVLWAVEVDAVHRMLPERLRCALEDEGSVVFTTELLAARAGTERAGSADGRARRRRAVRAVLRAAVAGRADRAPGGGAVGDHGRALSDGRVARRAPAGVAGMAASAGREGGGARAARPGERDRADAAAGARRAGSRATTPRGSSRPGRLSRASQWRSAPTRRATGRWGDGGARRSRRAVAKRRGRDSNPRWTLAHAGFQDRCIQPLCHPSECGAPMLAGRRVGAARTRAGASL